MCWIPYNPPTIVRLLSSPQYLAACERGAAMSTTSTSKIEQVFIPTGDRILVKRAPVEEKSSGGIFLADNAQDLPQYGTVLSYGTRVHDTAIHKGDTVYFGKYAGKEIKINGEVLLLMREDEIEGVIA